jgi:hypothetical protein
MNYFVGTGDLSEQGAASWKYKQHGEQDGQKRTHPENDSVGD